MSFGSIAVEILGVKLRNIIETSALFTVEGKIFYFNNLLNAHDEIL